ncbi:hypothetical protein CRENBAI_023978 [Crenichthys baileyi]|uniref:Uncharacterized protein n=1 Tax=Crenichthys baileyi TaxID=28760 RepID=A0AAV9S2Z8_9TELE
MPTDDKGRKFQCIEMSEVGGIEAKRERAEEEANERTEVKVTCCKKDSEHNTSESEYTTRSRAERDRKRQQMQDLHPADTTTELR